MFNMDQNSHYSFVILSYTDFESTLIVCFLIVYKFKTRDFIHFISLSNIKLFFLKVLHLLFCKEWNTLVLGTM